MMAKRRTNLGDTPSRKVMALIVGAVGIAAYFLFTRKSSAAPSVPGIPGGSTVGPAEPPVSVRPTTPDLALDTPTRLAEAAAGIRTPANSAVWTAADEAARVAGHQSTVGTSYSKVVVTLSNGTIMWSGAGNSPGRPTLAQIAAAGGGCVVETTPNGTTNSACVNTSIGSTSENAPPSSQRYKK
jgi:hypothetical protein